MRASSCIGAAPGRTTSPAWCGRGLRGGGGGYLSRACSQERSERIRQPALGSILRQGECPVQGMLYGSKHRSALRWRGRCPCQQGAHDRYPTSRRHYGRDEASFSGFWSRPRASAALLGPCNRHRGEPRRRGSRLYGLCSLGIRRPLLNRRHNSVGVIALKSRTVCWRLTASSPLGQRGSGRPATSAWSGRRWGPSPCAAFDLCGERRALCARRRDIAFLDGASIMAPS